MVDRDHSHADVRLIGAHIEIAQPVEAGWGVVEVRVYVSVQHEAEFRTPLSEKRRRRSWRGRGLSGRGIIGRLRRNGGCNYHEEGEEKNRIRRCPHSTPSVSVSVEA